MREIQIIDHSLAASILPVRRQDSSKGTFGRVTLVVGSEKYAGAAMLATEAALRGGVGYVEFFGSRFLCDKLLLRFPEVIYNAIDYTLDGGRQSLLQNAARAKSILVGSGCGSTESLYLLLSELLSTEGSPIVLDADALNVISAYGGTNIISASPRTVILTPHPLEFSRLSGLSLDEIQSARTEVAADFARKYGCILVLKGSGTVISDGDMTYVNSSGSSALAKAGSGDVLTGLMSALLAFSEDPIKAAALAVYIHGKAGDNLAASLSEFGVTPSDLPIECARVISSLTK